MSVLDRLLWWRTSTDETESDDVSFVTDGVSPDEFKDIRLHEMSARDELASWVQNDLDFLDEAPVPVVELTDGRPGDDSLHLSYPATRIFAGSHYGTLLWGYLYVFTSEPTGENLMRSYTLTGHRVDGRFVLGQRWKDTDVNDYLETEQ